VQLVGSWDRTHGSGMNSPSRLAQNVGWGPEMQSYQSFSTCYKDTGLWGVYFVCDGMAVEDFTKHVQEEWFVGFYMFARAGNFLTLCFFFPGSICVCP
jgi:hypothetical protein